MDGATIENVLKKGLCCTRTHFLGVFALDQLPKLTQFPCCFVANTDPISLPGTHWVAFYYDSPTSLEFFDSYGQTPHEYKFPISKKISSLTCNSYPIQSLVSTVCGQFCIFYLFHRARNIPLTQIISELRSFPDPESYVRSFVTKIRSQIKSESFSCSNFQTCKCKH